jgi:hypothetical protein
MSRLVRHNDRDKLLILFTSSLGVFAAKLMMIFISKNDSFYGKGPLSVEWTILPDPSRKATHHLT